MRSSGHSHQPGARHSVALAAVSLALLLQCLAPPGYMAGSLDDGWPVVLCPEGLPPGFLGQHGHHHHEEASGEDLSLDGYCPLGGMLDASAGLAPLNLDADPTVVTASLNFYRSPAPYRRIEGHPARAPPAHV